MFVLPWKILASDCDYQQKLKLSSLLRAIEEISIEDTTRLHMGREKTLDQGFLWVISRISLKITSLPEYDDHVKLITYPEKRVHVIFPRYYILKSALGKTYLEAESLWTLIDKNTRKPIDPKENGILIRAFPFHKESEILPVIHTLPVLESTTRKVLTSELDLNGHLTNTRYADWFMDAFGSQIAAKKLATFTLAFHQEAKADEVLTLGMGHENSKAYLIGTKDGKDVFEISATFAD
jgi:medium-chain acyl-[acyl-carrier-protein] hydrolase